MDRTPGTLRKDISKVAGSLIWIKLVGVGDMCTGKTSLIKAFCESQFTAGYQATVGVDYGFKLCPVQEFDLRVHLWDFSGSPEFLEIRNELYMQTDGAFVVFDLCNVNSFNGVEYWIREVQRYTAGGGSGPPDLVLVGNKCDLREDRAITATEAKKLAQKHKMAYYETSSATGEGVLKMFTDLLGKVVSRKRVAWNTKIIAMTTEDMFLSNPPLQRYLNRKRS